MREYLEANIEAVILTGKHTIDEYGERFEIRWFVQTALTEYSTCDAMALRLAEEDRKTFDAGGRLTVVRIRDKEGTTVTIFYRCLPDTFDPRAQKVD